MSALPHGATVTWNSSTVSDVVDFDCPKACIMVECNTLNSEQVDNRPGLRNPSANVTYSLKNGNVWDIEEGDVGTLVVKVPISGSLTEIFNETLACESVGPGGAQSANTHQTARVALVSTEATPGT